MVGIRIRRRTVLAGGLAYAVSRPAIAQGVKSLDPVRLSIIPILEGTPLHSALDKGWFKEEGLEIILTPSSGGAVGIPGLLGGSFDIVGGNVVSTLLAAQQGLAIQVVDPGSKVTVRGGDGSHMMVRSDSGINSGKYLEGKSIAVNTRNGAIWLYARAWVKQTGGDPDKVTFREVPFPQMQDALRQKQVDAAFMVAPYVVLAALDPTYKSIGMPYADVQLGLDVGHYVAASKYVAEKGDILARFSRALRKGIVWANENRKNPELWRIMNEFTRIDISVLQRIPFSPWPLVVDPAQMEKTMAFMLEHKLLKAPVDVRPLIAPTAI